jgi:DASH complex subunit DAD2
MLPPGAGGAAMRQPSGQHAISQQQSSALAGRIAAKKAELDNLKQLRDLSGALSSQMQMLEGKIATLKDGTEGWIPALIVLRCFKSEGKTCC